MRRQRQAVWLKAPEAEIGFAGDVHGQLREVHQ